MLSAVTQKRQTSATFRVLRLLFTGRQQCRSLGFENLVNGAASFRIFCMIYLSNVSLVEQTFIWAVSKMHVELVSFITQNSHEPVRYGKGRGFQLNSVNTKELKTSAHFFFLSSFYKNLVYSFVRHPRPCPALMCVSFPLVQHLKNEWWKVGRIRRTEGPVKCLK